MACSINILGLTSFLIPEMTDILKENDTRHPAYEIHYTFDPVSGLVLAWRCPTRGLDKSI